MSNGDEQDKNSYNSYDYGNDDKYYNEREYGKDMKDDK